MTNRRMAIKRELAICALFCIFNQIVIGPFAFAGRKILDPVTGERTRKTSTTISSKSSASWSTEENNTESDSEEDTKHKKKKRKKTSPPLDDTDDLKNTMNLVPESEDSDNEDSENKLQQEQTSELRSSSSSAHSPSATTSPSSSSLGMKPKGGIAFAHEITSDLKELEKKGVFTENDRIYLLKLTELKDTEKFFEEFTQYLRHFKKKNDTSPFLNNNFKKKLKSFIKEWRQLLTYEWRYKFKIQFKENLKAWKLETTSLSSFHVMKSKGGTALANDVIRHLEKLKKKRVFTENDRVALLQLIEQESTEGFLQKFTLSLQHLKQKSDVSSSKPDHFINEIKLLINQQDCHRFRRTLKKNIEKWIPETTSSSSDTDSEDELQQEQTGEPTSSSSSAHPTSAPTSSSSSSHVKKPKGATALANDIATDLKELKKKRVFTENDRVNLLKLTKLKNTKKFFEEFTQYLQHLEKRSGISSSMFDNLKKHIELLNTKQDRLDIETKYSAFNSVFKRKLNEFSSVFKRTLKKNMEKWISETTSSSSDEDSEDEVQQEQTHELSSPSSPTSSSIVPITAAVASCPNSQPVLTSSSPLQVSSPPFHSLFPSLNPLLASSLDPFPPLSLDPGSPSSSPRLNPDPVSRSLLSQFDTLPLSIVNPLSSSTLPPLEPFMEP